MYEITLISKTEQEDKIKKLIEAAGGKIISNSALGRRKLAYPIKKETAGYYFDYLVEMEGEKINELNNKMKLEENLIRYLITQKRERVIKVKPGKKVKEVKEEIKTTPQKPIVIKEITKVTDKKIQKISKSKKPISQPKAESGKVETKSPNKEKKTSPIKAALPKTKLKEVDVTEDERLKALEDKLSELLKD